MILQTVMGEHEKPQRKLLNYLIFGPLNKPADSRSGSLMKPNQPVKYNKAASLENLLVELSQESEEVTFSQIIVQFLKLNSKFEQTSTILTIIVRIVS